MILPHNYFVNILLLICLNMMSMSKREYGRLPKTKMARIYFGVGTWGQEISNALLYLDEKEDKIKRFETAEDIMIKNIWSMTSDQEGMIWVNSYSGFFKITQGNKIEEVTPKNVSNQPDVNNEIQQV
jgi:hypothetical protein